MPPKLVVTANKKGSRIALVGSSGKELLSSATFTEPRAKGATLRALKSILGDDVTVEDNTVGGPPRRAARRATNANGSPLSSAKAGATKSTTSKRAVG